MSGLKLIKRRINSIKSTQQITRVMKMVAAAKLRRSQENIIRARPYSLKLRQVIRELSDRIDRTHHPLLEVRKPERIGIVVVAGDRGMCGAFNTNILKAAQRLMDQHAGQEICLITVGRKGTDFFSRRGVPISTRMVNFFNHLEFSHAVSLGHTVIGQYIEHGMDRVYLVYNEFKSVIQQNVVVEQLLPILPDPNDVHPGISDIIYEPSEEEILNAILPLYVNVQIWRVLLESFAAEMGAKMTAMENATKNAGELIQTLTMNYNKARQAAITGEILEVVAGCGKPEIVRLSLMKLISWDAKEMAACAEALLGDTQPALKTILLLAADLKSCLSQFCLSFPDAKIVAVETASADPLKFRDGEFDAAVAMDVVNALPRSNRRAFFRELVRVANRDALAIMPLGTELQSMIEKSLAKQYYEIRGSELEELARNNKYGLPVPEEIFDWKSGDEFIDMYYAGDVLAYQEHAENRIRIAMMPAPLRGVAKLMKRFMTSEGENIELDNVPTRRHRRMYVHLRKAAP